MRGNRGSDRGRGKPGGTDRRAGRAGAPVRSGKDEPRRAPAAVAPAPPEPPLGARLAGLDVIEVRIEKLVAGGEGLARVEGVPVFVLRSAPGDLLRARLIELHQSYGRAEIVEILEPGPGRRPDPFPELSRAGAADLQHLRDDLQPLLKAGAVRETLERLGKLTLPAGDLELITGAPWGYRLRTQLHSDVDPVAGGIRVGYHARGTNELIPLTRCPLLVPELEALLAELPEHLGPASPRRLDLTAGAEGDFNAVSVTPTVPGLPHGDVSLLVHDITYSYDARCFFQAHRGLLPRLVDVVVGPWEGDAAFDLYAGVGLFSLPLARRYRSVRAVESDATAARFARLNARRNHLLNVEADTRAVESWIAALPQGADRVVVDPPRTGLSMTVRRTLIERRPHRLTYVSCHPATLARDLRLLAAIYDIEKITLLDLFPQTGHMETVVQLALRREE